MAAANNGIGSLGFLTGANLPWINYGWDYGPCAWGRGYKPEAFDAAFADLASRGANCVRLWVFGDGRASPSFDLSTPATRSLTTGLHPEFFADFGDMLNRAQKHQIKVMPVLWDFIALNTPKPTDKPTPQQGGHGALFTDPNLANAFMENALRPLIQRFGNHPAVAAWDVFNEPEWCVAETGEATTAQKVPLAAMRTFIGRASSIIHNEGAPGTLVTVGSASVKWSWERGETRPAWCSDFWGDAALVAANTGGLSGFRADALLSLDEEGDRPVRESARDILRRRSGEQLREIKAPHYRRGAGESAQDILRRGAAAKRQGERVRGTALLVLQGTEDCSIGLTKVGCFDLFLSSERKKKKKKKKTGSKN